MDLVHIDKVVAELLEEDAQLHLVQGEIISECVVYACCRRTS